MFRLRRQRNNYARWKNNRVQSLQWKGQVMASFIAEGNAIAFIDNWLDSDVDEEYINQPMAQDGMRILKIAEELGEATQKYIGVTGQNPRKGIYSTTAEVNEELADTAWTAILAIQHFTKDEEETARILANRLDRIYRRAVENTR